MNPMKVMATLNMCTDEMIDNLYGENSIRAFTGYSGSYSPSMDYGIMLTFSTENNYNIQLMFGQNSSTVKFRHGLSSIWEAWRMFTFT